jgi:hypothetical protein
MGVAATSPDEHFLALTIIFTGWSEDEYEWTKLNAKLFGFISEAKPCFWLQCQSPMQCKQAALFNGILAR